MKKRWSILVAALLLASPVTAQTPAQLDSVYQGLGVVETEMVRARAFNRASETQQTKVLNAIQQVKLLLERLLGTPSDTIVPDPEPDTVVTPPPDTTIVPPDTTTPPEPLPEPPLGAREFLIGRQVPMGASPWPNFDAIQVTDLEKWAARYLADQSGGDTYYDLPWALYQLHARTGDSTHLALAQAVAAKYWESLATSTGWTANPNPFSVAPRTLPFTGLLIYLLDGGGTERQTFTNRQDSTWSAQYNLAEWLEGWVRAEYPNWLGRRINNDHLWAGIRDGSMLLEDIAHLVVAWPDSADRVEFAQWMHDASVTYYARLQWADGSWKWNPGDFTDATQPFMTGLLLSALSTVHQVSRDTAVLRALVKGGEAFMRDMYDTTYAVPHRPDQQVRGALYIAYGGGPCEPPIEPSEPQCGNNVAGASGAWEAGNKIKVIRHRNTFMPYPLAYTCHATQDQRFCDWAREVFSATYAGDLGPGADGLTAVMPALKGKEANQLFRTAGRALWYLAN